jgi:hypothetical protein
MSKVALSGNASGSGTVTLAAPNTNSTVTLNLPDTAGTVLIQDGTNTTTVTNLAYTGTLTGGTGVVNIGSGQVYKDASGNVGIGVTPSAWSGVGPALQIGTSAAIIGNSASSASFLQNAYYNGSAFTYLGTGFATRFQATNGGYSWSTAPSGTAGNAISFTQAMTLTAAGDLQVGTGVNQATLKPKVLMFYNTGASDGLIQSADDSSTFTSMGINKTELKFYTNNSERMRIDSSGNLLVGVTSPAQTLSTNNVLTLKSSGTASVWGVGPTNSYGTFYITTGGTGVSLAGGGTSWGTVSDERQKDIIEPITDSVNKVLSLRAVIGKYKTDEEGKRRTFLIAQDVEKVLPEAVDKTDLNNLSLRYTELIPLLTAAIQELTARLEALENK